MYGIKNQTHPVTYHRVHILTPLGVVNNEGRTPLGEAVYWNNLEVVKYLITEHGVDVNGEL